MKGQPKPEVRLLSNIVLMGMGEPLYKLRQRPRRDEGGDGRRGDRARSAPDHPVDLWRGARDRPLRDGIGCLLAVSFHATTDAVRDVLVPVNKKWNIATLLDALRAYPGLSNSERITFEYVMLDGVNDTKEDAHRLVKLLDGIPAKVNLIPFNEWPGAPYKVVRQSDPRLRRHHPQCGLCLADPHAEGRGHHGGLRAAEIGDGTGSEEPEPESRGKRGSERTPGAQGGWPRRVSPSGPPMGYF